MRRYGIRGYFNDRANHPNKRGDLAFEEWTPDVTFKDELVAKSKERTDLAMVVTFDLVTWDMDRVIIGDAKFKIDTKASEK